MQIADYSTKALTTLGGQHAYGDITPDLMSQVLGLVGESGEVAEKFKKLLRDKNGELSDETKAELATNVIDVVPKAKCSVNSCWRIDDVIAVLRRDWQWLPGRDAAGVGLGQCRVGIRRIRYQHVAEADLIRGPRRRILNE